MATASAVINNTDKIGVITRYGVGKDLLDKEMDMAIDRRNDVPVQGARLFRREESVTGVYKETTVGNEMPQPVIQEDTDDVRYDTPPEGFDIEKSVEIYRMGIRVTRSMVERQRIKKIPYIMDGLMDAMTRNYEYSMADAGLNNAFATNVGADGMYMCDTGHPNEDYMTGTWDNLETAGALTPASYSSMRVNMRKRTNALGEVDPMFPDLLIVAPDNEEAAWQILNSPMVPDSSLRGKSWNYEATDLFVYDYLTDTDAYFLADTRNIQKDGGLVCVETMAPVVRANPSPKADILFDEYIRADYVCFLQSGRKYQGNAGS